MTIKSKQQTSFPKSYLRGLNVNRGNAAQAQIFAGECRSDDDSFDMVNTTTLNTTITSSGAGGLDTGSEAASTWYYVWLIFNPSTKTYAAMLSISSTSPTMPSGYTKKRRVGVVRNDASSNFLSFICKGTKNTKKYLYLEDMSSVTSVLSGGTATTNTNVNCGAFVPPTYSTVIFGVDTAASNGWLKPSSMSGDLWFLQGTGTMLEMTLGSGEVATYRVASGGNMDIAIVGFYEEL